jgi:hypothetical protein
MSLVTGQYAIRESSGSTRLVRLLMPVLLHRTGSKGGPCAAWSSSGRTDIPEISPRNSARRDFEKIERFIYTLFGDACARSREDDVIGIFIVRAVRRQPSGYTPPA